MPDLGALALAAGHELATLDVAASDLAALDFLGRGPLVDGLVLVLDADDRFLGV